MAGKDDPYQVLGVTPGASQAEIQRAYRRLARRHHPDRNPQPDGPERFRTIAEAYEVLNDPGRRARYDHTAGPPRRRAAPRDSPAVVTRRGVLELSAREARLAASTSLELTGPQGGVIALPAGVADGDQLIIPVPGGQIVLTVRINRARKT